MKIKFIESIQIIILFVTVIACSDSQFSVAHGFNEYFMKYPRTEKEPELEEIKLLKQYRPRVYGEKNGNKPIRFYEDYIAHGKLYDEDGNVVEDSIDISILNKYKYRPKVTFVYQKPKKHDTYPVAYGRIDKGSLMWKGEKTNFLFLTYNFVFSESGLPASIKGFYGSLINLVGDLNDWHQLDHYVGLTIAIRESDMRPVAVTFQQHNHLTTYILAKQLKLPADNRIKADFAIRSNEMYPHKNDLTVHKSIAFPSVNGMKYLVGMKERPLFSEDDITNGEVEIDYKLRFLPQSDAFYSFLGMLGENRLIPGRSGPPGADFNTLPKLKPKAVSMIAFYRKGMEDKEFLDLYEKLMQGDWFDPHINEELLHEFTTRFMADLPK